MLDHCLDLVDSALCCLLTISQLVACINTLIFFFLFQKGRLILRPRPTWHMLLKYIWNALFLICQVKKNTLSNHSKKRSFQHLKDDLVQNMVSAFAGCEARLHKLCKKLFTYAWMLALILFLFPCWLVGISGI